MKIYYMDDLYNKETFYITRHIDFIGDKIRFTSRGRGYELSVSRIIRIESVDF